MSEIFTRRNVLIGAGGVVIVAGAALEIPRLLRKHYPPTPYDDLLALLDDRDLAAQLGKTVAAADPTFDATTAAGELRRRLKTRTLAGAMAEDEAEGRLLEAKGWVYPRTLALLCALAARAI